MTVRPFVVPDLGEGLEEVTLTRWNVAVGDDVELNQTLCSVETAKAEVEIPCPYAGRIVEACGAEGDVLPVGSVLVRIDTAPGASNGESSTRRPVLVGYGADDTLDTSRRPKAKPPVRKLAADLGVDLAAVPPGPDGVVTREAVLAAAEDVDYDVLPVRGVHAEMAKRMTLSRSEIPDAHASVQVDCTELVRLHERLQVSSFALSVRFLVIALTRHRILNSTWVEAPDGLQVHTHRAVHLGVAVAAPRGLLVPVLRDAHRLTLRELADSLTRVIKYARAGSLQPAQLRGSTFTVSNFGALGLDDGVPVINHPEAAILGMGSLKPRPMALEDVVVVRPQMNLTCAFDHRVADGAQVAAFLTDLRQLIESPEMALLDL
ncbi:dihydrolipoamide acetyltransferase family protein [Mycobacterium shimoidei]|uniref:dihydrolipoamide acetyltransferase family protein n=1 Tax=Mycobacterium shimoidei TaxID=29313 RepID=UPI0008489D70|nr:dihydrolipoamide acetyltransferase family protein [Mycobacterium shimoidei]MCV7259922.1 2-oxo acid dehydrogenase subunit E2 [Mycobacterium shimoidei]ODR15035.1 branched-chain alpha-keto acid dehydrogenase subunit E2 [Mycobacterium shimoidei]ORW79200.1 branched-chain alpha-keto acid dehydrogenase subunit E2 [Mycobacterium shimoidei]